MIAILLEICAFQFEVAAPRSRSAQCRPQAFARLR
jgi:hypothetical protein